MGNSESRQINWFLDAIICGRDNDVAKMLKDNPELAKCEFHNGTTNPMCRATYLGRRNIIVLLLKHGADINKRSFDGRTSLHWAAFRNNIQILELLVSNDVDISLEDKDGFNALDLAITRINYRAAYYLVSETDLKPKSIQEYEGKTWRKMDIQLFLENLSAGIPDVPYENFFEKQKREREEWLQKDLVVDRRESWRNYIWRQLNFVEAPLVPREELPEHLQPQSSIRGKLINYINGVDPRVTPHNRSSNIDQNIDDPEKFLELQEKRKIDFKPENSEQKSVLDDKNPEHEKQIKAQIQYFQRKEKEAEAYLENDRQFGEQDGFEGKKVIKRQALIPGDVEKSTFTETDKSVQNPLIGQH